MHDNNNFPGQSILHILNLKIYVQYTYTHLTLLKLVCSKLTDLNLPEQCTRTKTANLSTPYRIRWLWNLLCSISQLHSPPDRPSTASALLAILNLQQTFYTHVNGVFCTGVTPHLHPSKIRKVITLK